MADDLRSHETLIIQFDSDRSRRDPDSHEPEFTLRETIGILEAINEVYETFVYLELHADDLKAEVPLPDVYNTLLLPDKPISALDLVTVRIEPGSLILILKAIGQLGQHALGTLQQILDHRLREAMRREAEAKATQAEGNAINQAIKNSQALDKISDPVLKAAIRDKIVRSLGALPAHRVLNHPP